MASRAWVETARIKVAEGQSKKVDQNKVERHRRFLEDGGEMMPIDVVRINDSDFCICGNGRHRYFGCLAAGFTIVEVNVLN